MKKILYTLIFSFWTISLFSQIQLDPQFIESHFENEDLSDEFLTLISYVDVTNNFDEKVELKWVREIIEPCISDWIFQCCDNVACYPSNTNTNYDPSVGLTDTSYVLQPGETHKFSFYTKPTFKAGCCTSKVYFSTIQDPDDILATLDVDIKVNDPECLVSTKLVLQDEVRIFPNPVSNSVQITGHPSIEKMKIYSVLGELVKELDAKGKTSFDVNDLISGTYFIALTGKENELLKTSRITKQ